MKNRSRYIIPLFAVLTASLISCSPIRKYPAGNYLLTSNKLIMNKNQVDAGELKDLIRQKPNKKNLGLYLNIRLWNYSTKGKETGFKRWIKNTFSAEPVILDTSQTLFSLKQMNYYLENHGYFKSDISYTIKYPSNHKRNAKVIYNVNTKRPYKIKNVSYSIDDETIKKYVSSEISECKIIPGQLYNIDNIDAERDRITRTLRENGYYYFTKDYITFNIDSALNQHEMDIMIRISDALTPSPVKADSLIPSKHKIYTINKIIINTDYEISPKSEINYDTARVVISNRVKNRQPKTYYYVYRDKLKIIKKTLSQAIFIDSADVFNISDIEKNYKSLLDLRIYRFVNIKFNEVNVKSENTGELECIINLTKAPVQALSISTETTNKGGELGLQAGIVYENKNLFRGADLFNIKLNGAVEFQSLKKQDVSEKQVLEKIPFVNTIETGLELSLRIPRFLIPISQNRFPKYFKPKTTITGIFNYQIRPIYERYYASGSFGYQWKENDYKTHILTPLQLNIIKIYPDSVFKAQIDALNNITLQNAYRDHITTSLNYSFIYNTQQINKIKDFIFLRTNVELAGLIFWAVNQVRKKQGVYTLFEIPYSQYYRMDIDFRYYMVFNEYHRIVYRAYAGYGSPFDEKNVLPFERSFYMGGANSMRGWRLKTLGPGGYSEPDSLSLEKIGEIALELNTEYRFPIYKILRGAIFVDVGNIWTRKASNLLPLASFKFKNFIHDLAIDAGAGLRVDFGYFVIRLDGAVVLKDPSMPRNQRWIGQNDKKFTIIGNLGIGYPF
ncbi:MAG: BamA/TamA family outer membrane protein [Bacteroidales bacterium]|nr:BamA/TamA family outer membrane protein [Bacteroidales bacterium]MDD4213694.1 BamA/TamA family outer membrane protein [Bacteroidales bacterium]